MTEPMSQSRPGSSGSSNPQWKGTLGLAVALTVVASAAWWMEYSWKPKKEEDETQSRKVLRLKGEAVAELRLGGGSTRFAFQCLDKDKNLCKPGDASKWRMIEPREMRADDSNVNSFLSALSNAQSAESIDLSEDTEEKRAQLLKDYGLGSGERSKAESRRVEVTLVSGEKRSIWIGGNHPIGDQLFTLSSLDGEKKVHLLPSYFKTHFERDLTYWRNKKVFEFESNAVASFQAEGPHGKLRAERKDGSWQLAALGGRMTEVLPGDAEAIDNVLGAAGNLSARAFAAEDKNSAEGGKALAGTKELIRFGVTLKDSTEPLTLVLHERHSPAAKKAGKEKGGKETELFATVSNLKTVFEVDNSVRNRLDKPIGELRLKRPISSVDRLAATRIAFEGAELGASGIEFQLSDSKWKLGEKAPASDAGSIVESEKIGKLLEKMAGRQIEEFVTGKDIPVGENQGLRLYLGTDVEPRKHQFLFWKAADKRLYGKDLLSKRNEAWKLQSAMKSALPWTRDFLLKSAVPAASSAPAGTKTPVTGGAPASAGDGNAARPAQASG